MYSILTCNKQVNRFARRSRALHRLDIIADDVSSLATSSARSSYASSTASGSTITGSSPTSFHNRAQSTGPDFSSNPPSYRSAPSVAGVSIRSSSTTSTLASHLANQRRPPQPPPLIAQGTGSHGSGDAHPISRVGVDGRNRLARSHTPSPSTSDAGRAGINESSSETGNANGGRRLSRRASFFARLRNVGS